MAAAEPRRGGDVVNNKTVAGLVVGALVLGLFAGLALGDRNNDKSNVAGPGPRGIEAGVPVGFERSRPGAAAAAISYESALTDAGVERYRAVVNVVAVPARRDAIAEAMRPGLELVRERLGEDAFVRGAVVGHRLKAYDAGEAEVEVWEVGVVAASSLAPQAGWTTTTIRLRWLDGDWKLTEAPEVRNGPTPQQPDTPTAAEEFLTAVRGMEEVRYVSVQ
jgi:hypothetical protein